MLRVSARLDGILTLLHPCQLLADVGTDHGMIPVAAVQRGLAARAIAADLRAQPLAVARQNIERAALQAQIMLVQGDGLSPLLPHAVDAIVIAGMSGALMVRMFESVGALPASITQLVLQPNQDAGELRAWARTHGFHLSDERMVEERTQFFPICRFVRGQGLDPAYDAHVLATPELCTIGPLLLSRRCHTTLRFCHLQRARLAKLVERGLAAHEAELSMWQRACEWLQR